MKQFKQTQNHMTSLRLPKEWHIWVAQFADRWDVSPAYIYRSAIREFIEKQKIRKKLQAGR